MKKFILCMCVLLCACTSAKQPEPIVEETVKKPEKISVHFEGYEDEFEGKSSIKDICQQYEEDTGIKLDIEGYQGGSYYNGVLLSSLTQGKYEDIPNVLFVPYWFYERGSRYGWFWDMTDAWENSSIRSITDEKYVDAAKIDGRLYGFPANRYNGTVTYVRKDWLEATGLDIPTNYEEFINMLREFKKQGFCSYPYTAPNITDNYNIKQFWREFVWTSDPDICYDKASDTYFDGFDTPSFKAALERIRTAYAQGLIDPDIFANSTAACRGKVSEGFSGVFNYWAGKWNVELDNYLSESEKNNGGSFIPIPAIEETCYIENQDGENMIVILNKAEDPEGIFKYFIEYSHDGGKGQTLFTRGAEGKQYVVEDEGKAKAMPMYDNKDKIIEGIFYDPFLSLTQWDDPVTDDIAYDERVTNSLKVMRENSNIDNTYEVPNTVLSELPEELQDCYKKVTEIKKEVMEKAITGQTTVDEAMSEYHQKADVYLKKILEALNNKG